MVYRAMAKEADLYTVRQMSSLSGVSVRTLHYYDGIGLLIPSSRSDAGYRLYGDADLARLHQIMLFRELEFSLADIRLILDAPDFDQCQALAQQIELLKMRRERIDLLIKMAKGIQERGVEAMGFEAFDKSKQEQYATQAKALWGGTPQWAEYEAKMKGEKRGSEAFMGEQLMLLFVPFGRMASDGSDPSCQDAQEQVSTIRAFITENFYTCTKEVLRSLGEAYGAGGDFTRNINEVAGPGAAEYAAEAIAAYCSEV